jgi:hypothetical protein
MDESYRMTLAQRRLSDTQAVYRHRARLVTDDFMEVRHLWPDRRGKSFADRHLDPQLDSIEHAQVQLQHQAETADTAVRMTIATEDNVRQCQAALTEFEADNQEALRLNRIASDIAGRVAVKAGAISDDAGRIDGVVAQLL